MIGVNQVIMQCLAMVVIASFIGAPGLGYKVLIMLNNLRIGKALELGVSIVLIAIILDRLSLAWAGKQPDYTEDLPFYLRYKTPLMILGLVSLSILFSFLGSLNLFDNSLKTEEVGFISKFLLAIAALIFTTSMLLIVIVLNRWSLTWANKKSNYTKDLPFYLRYKYPLIVLGLVSLGIFVSLFFPFAYQIPRGLTITTEPFWDAGVFWIAEHWFDGLQSFRVFLSLGVLIPMRDAYLSLPTFAVLVLVVGAGWILGGVRSAMIVLAYLLFIILSDWWDRTMITTYLVSFAVIVCVSFGVPIGILASRIKWLQKSILTLCDTFQTFPSFIYLIPVIMLFQVNDVSAAFAVIIYATIPITRYTIEGLRNIPVDLKESVTMSGANKWQKLCKLELPLAFPHIMLGLNQTVLFSLFMVIIAAFIGTQDLGQKIMEALSESDMGKGLVLGLCVAFIGLIIDHLINKWALDKKAKLGLTS